jgi:predicted GIY-YIG superfamily endonuclease
LAKYRVYVIELSKKAFTESKKFRTANPHYNGILECLYVGMTSKRPDVRFQEHKEGKRSKRGFKLSSSIVHKYGLYLRPSLYQHLSATSRAAALEAEENLALELRKKGYAVWYN